MDSVASIRRLNEMLSENAHAPTEERWILAPFVVVGMICALVAFVAAGQLLGAVISGVTILYFTWDGWRRFRRSTR
jgi:hypothetical protein